MKKSLLIAGLIFGALTATAQSLVDSASIVFSPLGYWPVCNANHLTAADNGLCAALWQPGHEPYLLIIRPVHAGATAYRYLIQATDATGKPVEFRGLVNRADAGSTTQVVDCGILSDVHVSVEELVVIAARKDVVR